MPRTGSLQTPQLTKDVAAKGLNPGKTIILPYIHYWTNPCCMLNLTTPYFLLAFKNAHAQNFTLGETRGSTIVINYKAKHLNFLMKSYE